MKKYPYDFHYKIDYRYWKNIEIFSNPHYRNQIPKELQRFCQNSQSKFIRWIIDKYTKRFQKGVS